MSLELNSIDKTTPAASVDVQNNSSPTSVDYCGGVDDESLTVARVSDLKKKEENRREDIICDKV